MKETSGNQGETALTLHTPRTDRSAWDGWCTALLRWASEWRRCQSIRSRRGEENGRVKSCNVPISCDYFSSLSQAKEKPSSPGDFCHRAHHHPDSTSFFHRGPTQPNFNFKPDHLSVQLIPTPSNRRCCFAATKPWLWILEKPPPARPRACRLNTTR